MHFKLDENIPLGLAKFLRLRDFKVSSIYSQKLSGVKDKRLALHCKKENLILITLDTDFQNTIVFPPKEFGGIIVLRPKSQGLKTVTKFFKRFLEQFDISTVKNRTVIVEPKHTRIRE